LLYPGHQQKNSSDGWLVGRLTSPFSTQTGYIGDKVFGGDCSDTVTSRPCCLSVQRWPKMVQDRGGSFELLR